MKNEYVSTIRHFTNADALYKILEQGLKFSSGRSWSDKDDVFDIKQYSKIIKKDVAVLCMCNGMGNLHHWAIIRNKGKGLNAIKCSIVFNKNDFLRYVSSLKKFEKPRKVKYCSEIDVLTCDISDIPYLKKREYDIEKEIRFIYLGCDAEKSAIIPNIVPYIKCIEISKNGCSKTDFNQIRTTIENLYPQLKGRVFQYDLSWKEKIKILIQHKLK